MTTPTSAVPGLAWPGLSWPGDPSAPPSAPFEVINEWPIEASNSYGNQGVAVSNTEGNALIAILACGSNSQQVLPRFCIADDAHNNWQFAGSSPQFTAGLSHRVDVWVAPNADPATWVSVGESWFTSGVAGLIIEVQGFPTWAQVDFVATSTPSGPVATINPSGIATGSDFVVGGVATGAPDVTSFFVQPSGFALMSPVNTGLSSPDMTSFALNPIAGSFPAGTVSATWSWVTGASIATAILVGFSASPTAPVQPNPNWPLVKFEAAFGWQPGNLTGIMPTWTDITSRAQDEDGGASFYSGRGRDYELTQPAAGGLRMRFDNHEGAFDPANVPKANVSWNGNGSINPQVENTGSRQPVTPNAFYGFAAYLWQSVPTSCRIAITWYTSLGGGFISSSTVTFNGSATPVLCSLTGQAPATAGAVDIAFAGQGTPPASTTFFAAATSVNPFYPGTTPLTLKPTSLWPGTAGTTVQSQNGWTPSAPYYPYVNPETPMRVSAAWVNTGKTYPVGGCYTNKFTQSFDYPQWGMVQYEGSDGIGMSGQIKLPSALGGDILIDGPYAYFPLGEFYSVAGGAQFSNASRTNLRPAYGVDDTDRIANSALQTGQTLNLAGDPGTGIGITNVTAAPPAAHSGGAGAYYRDPLMPQMNPALAVEFEASVAAVSGSTNNQVDILRLVGYQGNYSVVTGDGSTTDDNGRLTVTLSRGSTAGYSMRIDLVGFSGSGVSVTSATSLINDANTHHYAVTITFDGTTWHVTGYMDGVSICSGTTTGVDPGVFTSILAMGPVVLGGGQRLAANYTIGHVALYGWALDPNRISSHATVGKTAGAGQFITGRYQRLHAWSGAQLPKATTNTSPSPLAGNADQLQGSTLSDAAYALTVDDGGMYYCDAQFNNWFAARSSFYNKTPKWVFSDQPGSGTHYLTGTGFDYSDTFLWNITSSQRTISSSTQLFVGSQNAAQAALGQFNSFGATGTAEDLASEQQFLPRGPLEQSIETTSDQDAYDRANWSLTKYKVPVLRPNQIMIEPSSNPAAWPVALGVEQGDIVSLSRTPIPAVTMSTLAVVQKIEHQAGPDLWQTTLTLSPYYPEGNVVQLDNAPYNTPSSGVLPW